ncbi:hypothetical protein EF909_25555 [Streptomyces sp. WAC01280]|nr:hypothetical protein EF909_25555 [Streptomyces sp. WAC01280]
MRSRWSGTTSLFSPDRHSLGTYGTGTHGSGTDGDAPVAAECDGTTRPRVKRRKPATATRTVTRVLAFLPPGLPVGRGGRTRRGSGARSREGS